MSDDLPADLDQAARDARRLGHHGAAVLRQDAAAEIRRLRTENATLRADQAGGQP